MEWEIIERLESFIKAEHADRKINTDTGNELLRIIGELKEVKLNRNE